MKSTNNMASKKTIIFNLDFTHVRICEEQCPAIGRVTAYVIRLPGRKSNACYKR